MRQRTRYMRIYKPHQTDEELWQDRALELRYSGPNCDQIPFGDESFDAMETHYDEAEYDYWEYYQCDIHYEPVEDQIKIYEIHGLVSKDEEPKPIKERDPICFPWQGVTVYTRY